MRPTTAFALIVAHTDMIAVLDAECEEHEAHIEAHHIRDAENANIISGLRIQLEDATNRAANAEKYLRENEEYASEARTAMNAQTNALRAEIAKLKQENYMLRYGGKTPEDTATAYMKNHGVEVWGGSHEDRLKVVKVVQEITGWGIFPAKEFCENYIKRASAEVSVPDTVEDSGPKTLRSVRSHEVKERAVNVATA